MSQHRPSSVDRSLSVDFFRGIGLFIIFINHIPFNELGLYTPSRFGFSDGAEIFVYCSGFVAALAFGRCFQQAGLWLGTVRVLYRCCQIYAVHINLFIALAIICLLGNTLFTHPDYIDRLHIRYFFDETREALFGLATLSYVPNYFDILPMYVVVLLWVPVVWTAGQIRRGFGLLLPIALYAAMWFWGWDLPADPRSDRPWFFNPFAWQLLFFIGFAFGSGWLRLAPGRVGLLRLSWAIVLLAIPLSYEPIYSHAEFLGYLRAGLEPLVDKTHFGLLRGLHFTALAYLAYSWLDRHSGLLHRPIPGKIRAVGEHSLPIFFLGMNLSYIGGMVLDHMGHGLIVLAWVNMGGCALLVAAAQGISWLGSKPWKDGSRVLSGWSWEMRVGSAQNGASRWKTMVIQSFSAGVLLLPLTVAPLYMVNRHAMIGQFPLEASPPISDSGDVFADPDSLPFGGGADQSEDGQGLDGGDLPSNLDSAAS